MAEGIRFATESEALRCTGRQMGRAPARQRRETQAIDWPDGPMSRVALTRAAIEAQRALREAAFAAATAAARARTMAAMLDQALEGLVGAEAAPVAEGPRRVTSSPIKLRPRDREVLALVAEGRSNKSIAEALFVFPNTVKTHVASLLRKHDVGTRTQLAAVAATRTVR